MAEPSVQSRVTQTRPISAMTPSIISTVTLLITQLPIETLRTTVLTQLSTDPWWTAAAPRDRITHTTVLTLTAQRAIPAEPALRTRLIANDPRPSVGTVTAVCVCVTHSSVSTILTRQTAVEAERAVQTNEFLS